MSFDENQIRELEKSFPGFKHIEDGGFNYFYIPNLKLPKGCVPDTVDALLCPQLRDGYNSRLFLSQQISGCPQRNWNGTYRISDRTWYAISWQTTPNNDLFIMLMIHLSAFDNGASS
jgi:hypothetical protein